MKNKKKEKHKVAHISR